MRQRRGIPIHEFETELEREFRISITGVYFTTPSTALMDSARTVDRWTRLNRGTNP